ncbi:transposase [Vibrio splendidus]
MKRQRRSWWVAGLMQDVSSLRQSRANQKGSKEKGGKIQWAVSWFQKLYRVEQALKDKPREERYVTRQSKTRSLLNEFKAWLDKSVTQEPLKVN